MQLNRTAPEIDFAIEAVRQAATLVKNVERELVDHSITKSDKSPVTVADFAAQALIGCLLERVFPNDPLVAEEDSAHLREPTSSETLGKVAHFVGQHLAYATPQTVCAWIDRGGASTADRFWTLDPIDGTKGFLRRDQYAVALALVVNGVVELGVLGCPNLRDGCVPDHDGPGSIIVAQRGSGSWTQSIADPQGPLRRIEVSRNGDASEAQVLRSVDAGHTNVGRVAELMQLLGVKHEPVLMDSQAKYAVMAAGKGDLLFRLLTKAQPDYRERIWDHAAGSIIVEEAGGRVTDLGGAPLDFTQGRALTNNIGIVATNGLLHDTALRAIKTVFQDYSA
jgi:HAL2 family 3'(2'),5'-bisphosphate nucleotidase